MEADTKQDIRGESILSTYGYTQKGNRYFWRRGTKTTYNQGFKSKGDCENWIKHAKQKYGLDWRCGFLVKFKAFQEQWVLVDRRGNEIGY